MKLKIIFPKRDESWYDNAIGKIAMPVAPTYLAALTPQGIEISVVYMMAGDIIDYGDESGSSCYHCKIYLKCYRTVRKQGGNRENKPQPVTSEETGLLDSIK